MLFNVFKKQNKQEKNIEQEVTVFIQKEQKRRQQADAFVRMMQNVIPYAMQEVWGITDPKIVIGETVLFKTDSTSFVVMKTQFTEIHVLELRGQAYWATVQEIMNFAHDLLEDITKREEGREQLLVDLNKLSEQMSNSSVGGKASKAFVPTEPVFLKNSPTN
ncbi:hypothetical protein [Paenibacillus sp. WLX2291]|uniref:hypothetical protein n=1 Tax=Paenibacillus sp. WLX2291 TaxID=3296934 RepID=UPI003983F429